MSMAIDLIALAKYSAAFAARMRQLSAVRGQINATLWASRRIDSDRVIRRTVPVRPGRMRDVYLRRQADRKVHLQQMLGAMPSGQTSPAASTGLSAEAIASLRRNVYRLKE